MTQAIRATLEPNVDLARLNPNRGTWERIEGKKVLRVKPPKKLSLNHHNKLLTGGGSRIVSSVVFVLTLYFLKLFYNDL